MKSADTYIQGRLDDRKASGTFRSLTPENGLIDFCSNDYLGFARSAELKELIAKEISEQTPDLNGATGSRLISGNLSYTEKLEQQIAHLHKSEAGLLFNSGYDANIGLFSSLPQKGDTIIHDERIHASIIDGTRLSHANRYTFRHNDPESLESKLKQARGICYVAIESVYSMDGDTPPIEAILALCELYNAHLIVDEAHAAGLYPYGLAVYKNLEDRIFARIITFGKALGCHGALILSSQLLRQYLINFARSFIYTTAAPFHQLAAIKCAYNLLDNAGEKRRQLQENISFFKQNIAVNSDQPLILSDSAIQCILLNSNEKARELAALLQQNGFNVRPILSPTVAAGKERIRICLHTYNTCKEIEQLTGVINTFGDAK